MRMTGYYFWSIVYCFFALVILIMALIILETEARIPYQELTVLDIAIIAGATWRLARLMSKDTITAWFREQFFDVKKVGRGYTLVQPTKGPRRVLTDLFLCPWCMSLVSAFFVTFFFLVFEWFYFIALVLAVAAVAAAVQVVLSEVVKNNH